jgi:hypothetical protein
VLGRGVAVQPVVGQRVREIVEVGVRLRDVVQRGRMRPRLLGGEEPLERDLEVPGLRGLEAGGEVAAGVVLRVGERDRRDEQQRGGQGETESAD